MDAKFFLYKHLLEKSQVKEIAGRGILWHMEFQEHKIRKLMICLFYLIVVFSYMQEFYILHSTERQMHMSN